jgi:hypothetical protein
MVRIDEIARAALDGDALLLRQLIQDWLRSAPRLCECPAPTSQDSDTRIVAAALLELLAERYGQAPPAWTASVGAFREPFFLLKSANTMRRLRELCESESPWPLRRRNLFAPANFLSFA